ncbi:hypothetical protein AB4K05_04725 [Kluyvera sp. STS39-E]|uniref:hypothetical protein n=1 Tax=Kluyvera sp. STS39-E TaxID=3234748 RepID=UPI0034C631F3
MNNNRDRNSRVSRAAVAGALVGGSTACLREWQRYQQSEQTLNEAACTVMKETAKASLISGTVMAIADANKGRPLESVLTIIGVGAASLYLMDALAKRGKNESA